MPILRGVLGKVPSGPKARVRNFIANKELGTKSDIHENVISPGVTVPWHFHETEEVIVVLEGNGECRTETGTETYAGGDIIILPPRVKHSLKNSGNILIRQICIFPDDPQTTFLESDYPGQTVDMAVSFYIDPGWVVDEDTKDFSELTLSYTFYPAQKPKEPTGKTAASGTRIGG